MNNATATARTLMSTTTPPPSTAPPAQGQESQPAQQVERDKEILDFLRLLGHGEFLAELAEARLECERALETAGKAAEVTIKIKQAPHGGNKRVLSYSITTKLPKQPASATYCFATESGQYVENNPDQLDLPLRTTATHAPGLRVVGSH